MYFESKGPIPWPTGTLALSQQSAKQEQDSLSCLCLNIQSTKHPSPPFLGNIPSIAVVRTCQVYMKCALAL